MRALRPHRAAQSRAAPCVPCACRSHDNGPVAVKAWEAIQAGDGAAGGSRVCHVDKPEAFGTACLAVGNYTCTDNRAKASKLACQGMLVHVWRQAPNIDFALWGEVVVWAMRTQTSAWAWRCLTANAHC